MTQLTLSEEVRNMPARDVIRYASRFIDADWYIEECNGHFCSDCDMLKEEPDIGNYDCPCGCDITDPDCRRYDDIVDRLRYIVQADIWLKEMI